MSSLLRRLAATPIPVRATIPRSTRILPRTYASTTKGGDTTNVTNLATPSPKPSDSPQEGDIKTSRAESDPASQEKGGSVSKPVSGENQTATGQDEEGGDPGKGMSKDMADNGGKPLDAADK